MKFSVHDAKTSCVVKPWGFEFELLANEISSVWCLYIDKHSSTSLHCHPTKKTGYLVVSGEVEIEFLSGRTTLSAGQKINFRPGLFHKTTALTEDVLVLEIETPINKSDLLRLEDSSGRSTSEYESKKILLSEAIASKKIENLFKASANDRLIFLGDLQLEFCEVMPGQFLTFLDKCYKSVIMILDGGLVVKSEYTSAIDEVYLASAGDVITDLNLKKLAPLLNSKTSFSALICCGYFHGK